jgi:hypothetical protein
MASEEDINDILRQTDSSLLNIPPKPKTKSPSSKPSGMEKSRMTADGEFLDPSPFLNPNLRVSNKE